MKTKTFAQSFGDVVRLSKDDIKPLGAKLGKLFEEGGELAECVNIHQGYITHKEMKEPLVGEVADVVQCALAILVDAHPELSKKELMDLFLYHFERKNQKWAAVQEGDADRITAQTLTPRFEDTAPATFSFENAKPASSPHDIDRRVLTIVAEQLGLATVGGKPNVDLDGNFVIEYGADSLDLVELVMAIEDEFEAEISDRDAERLETPRQVISYIKQRYGIEEDLGSFEESAAAIEDEARLSKALASPQPSQHFDPADDYTERSGRYLSLDERMNERSLFNNRKG